MGAHLDVNGETASLKKQKRKREPKDEASPTTKRHRTKSKSQVQPNGNAKEERKENGESSRLDNVPENHTSGPLLQQDRSAVVKAEPAHLWKLSHPMGGRMLNIDPIFSVDERYLILAYNTSIQVYSTQDSLLARRIAIPVTATETSAYISACILSPTSPDQLWVVCSDGRVWSINWTTGAGVDTPFTLDKRDILDVAVESVRFAAKPRDILLVLQRYESGGRLFAYDDRALSENTGVLLHTLDDCPHLVRSTISCKIVVVAAGSTIHYGSLKVKDGGIQTLANLEYQFCAFDVPDIVACLDLRPLVKSGSKGKTEIQQLDLVVGTARGPIFHYGDILSKLPREGSKNLKAGVIQPRKYHWHRKAVHSVKFSGDGNYLISGGSEQVLVLWQLDTNHLTFLPHLSGTLENIVVSPRGASYAIHLDDNSAMVISTEEMKPTTYVSGLQAPAHLDQPSKDSMVRRVWKESREISEPLVAAPNPTHPTQVVLCVGSGLQAAGAGTSTPQLQVFDITSFQGVTKHAIARTNPTETNITTHGVPIVDPTVTKLSFSADGAWLASVDEWTPPKADAEVFVAGSKTSEQICREKREVYLKFWEVGADQDSLQLVTRVNDPHRTDWPEEVFDLASDPSSTRFATLGADGVVRFWSPKLRRKDGLATTGSDGQQLRIWTCSQAITLPVPGQLDVSMEPPSKHSGSGALTFSDDGSILFAAFGEASEAAIVAIDTETGSIRETVYGMFRGAVRSIQSLGSYLILLSEDVVVYDIVSDELLYSYALKDTSPGARKFTQLAVNRESRCFALAAPIPTNKWKMGKGIHSELVIFSIENPEPQFSKTFSSIITSVTPAVGSTGFVVIDSTAQVWSITEGAEAAPLLQSLADLGVGDEVEPLDSNDILQDGDGSDEEMQDRDEDVDMDVDEDFDTHAAVVAPQRLAEVFGAAPAFAMPPIEDLFYQVAGLFSSKTAST